MRIFLDANVLFSAANAGSAIASLVQIIVREHIAVTSDLALTEARRNIVLKRPAWLVDFEAVQAALEVTPSTLFALPVELDEKDQPILCAAIRANCDLLATGDRRHFGAYYDCTIEGVTIVSLLGLALRILLAT